MPSKRRSGPGLLPSFVAFAVFVSGCAAATGPDDTGGRETSDPRGGDQAPQTTAVVAGSEPPKSTLSHGGETVEGGIGGYCWSSGGGGSCVDAVGVSLEEGALEAATGASLSFDYGGRELDSLDVAAYRADREGGGREDDIFVMPSRGGGAEVLEVRRSGTRARIVADLPAGEYVLDAPRRDARGRRLLRLPADREGTGYGGRGLTGVRDRPLLARAFGG